METGLSDPLHQHRSLAKDRDLPVGSKGTASDIELSSPFVTISLSR